MTRGKIPRRYFWLFDVALLGLTLVGANFLLPFIQKSIALFGLLRLPWVQALSLPSHWGGDPGIIVLEFLWVLFPMIPTTILCMEMLGGYRQLLNQSYTRIVINGFLSPLVGLSLIITTLFAVKNFSISRLYIFTFMVLSALGLCAYRIAMRMYFMRRKAAGRYAKNVLLIGMPSGIDFMSHYLRKNSYPNNYRIVGYLDLPARQPITRTSESKMDKKAAYEPTLSNVCDWEQPLRTGSK